MNTKIVAMYLPQYHRVPENDKFWGEGFTDWVSVKKGEQLFDGHDQPRVPLDLNYYDLAKKESISWQTSIAKRYGVYGFGIYHYWFSNNKPLLTKPVEILLDNPDIDFPFFFAWDNISWKRTWSKHKGNDWSPLSDDKNETHEGPEVLLEYSLGEKEDWKIHFEYLLKYFKDSRYIQHMKKPVFMIFHYSNKIQEMCFWWNKWAQEEGLEGIHFIFKYDKLCHIPDQEYVFTYEPIFSGWGGTLKRIKNKMISMMGKQQLQKYDYDKVWRAIIANAQKKNNPEFYHGAFVGYDDTPRRGNKGKVVVGQNPDKFEKYISKLIKISDEQKKDFIFLTAWNEWGEGAYLEPDETSRFSYLEALKRAIEVNS